MPERNDFKDTDSDKDLLDLAVLLAFPRRRKIFNPRKNSRAVLLFTKKLAALQDEFVNFPTMGGEKNAVVQELSRCIGAVNCIHVHIRSLDGVDA